MDDKKYDLNLKEFNECTAQAELAMFLGSTRAKSPKSFWIIAQPGAGKTALTEYIIKANQDFFGDNGYIQFNPDSIGKYHKYYKEIAHEFPEQQYEIVQRFTGPALDKYFRPLAVIGGYNLVQEGTFSSPAYMDILNFQKNGGSEQVGDILPDGTRDMVSSKGGYYVELDVLAVNRYESLLSSYEREQDFRDFGITPRIVVPQRHDYSYKKMLETIDKAEKRGLIDVSNVYRRGKLISDNGKSLKVYEDPALVYSSEGKERKNTVKEIENERQKEIDELLEDPTQYLGRIELLRQRIKENGIEEQLIRLGSLEQDFLEKLEERKKTYSIGKTALRKLPQHTELSNIIRNNVKSIDDEEFR